MDSFKTTFNRYYSLSEELLNMLRNASEIKHFEKLEVLAEIDKTDKCEYIVLDGVCRSFINDSEGKEATFSFYMGGDVFPPNQIRTVADKSLFNIQTVTEASIVVFDREVFATIMSEYSEIDKWGHAVYDIEIKRRVAKELNFITMTAKERLDNFRTTYPQLENLIPHPYIASYLGISPVSLSRLRGQR